MKIIVSVQPTRYLGGLPKEAGLVPGYDVGYDPCSDIDTLSECFVNRTVYANRARRSNNCYVLEEGRPESNDLPVIKFRQFGTTNSRDNANKKLRKRAIEIARDRIEKLENLEVILEA